MAEEDNTKNKSFISIYWNKFKDWISNFSAKIKLIIGAIAGVFAIIIYFIIKKEMNEKEILELQLNKLETEIKVKLKQDDIDENNSEITSLEEEKKKIIEKIEEIKKEEITKDDDLDKFFDDRGF